MKKTLIVSALIFSLISVMIPVYASNDVALNIVQKASETKYLENDQGYISKTIVDSDSEKGEVTVEVKLSNTSKDLETSTGTEIFLVVDNSGSMGYTTSTGEIRRNVVTKSIKNLTDSIYKNSSNVKVGLVRFAGNTSSNTLLTNGSTIMCNLTEDKEKMLEAINEFENLDTSVTLDKGEMKHCESGTNIESGLKRANDNFSKNCKNKIIILLTDGVPNYDVNNSVSVSKIYENTKTRLKNIGEEGVTILSMMTGINEDDGNDAQTIVESIFGTEEKPTTGVFYNISDTEIEEVVSNNIFKNVMEKIQNPINTIKIKDYFPQDILNNFEITISKPSIGTVSDKIDEETKSIEWNMDTLKGNEVATLQYKLKIKDMSKNSPIYNKEIATNEKIVLNYKDSNEKDYEVTLTSSPKIKLEDIKKEVISSGQKDTTVANKILPKAGKNIIIISIALSILLVIVGVKKYNKYRDVK